MTDVPTADSTAARSDPQMVGQTDDMTDSETDGKTAATMDDGSETATEQRREPSSADARVDN